MATEFERALDLVRTAAIGTRFGAVEWVAETGSTNDDLAAAAASGGAEQVLIADHQSSGRGRRGRAWTAPAGSAALMSFLVRDGRGVPPFWTIGSVILGVAEAATYHSGTQVGIKWPNDLLIGQAKVAGVLAVGAGGATIVGVGLNIDWSAGRPTGLPSHATALDRHRRGAAIDRPALIGDIIRAADGWLAMGEREVRDAWAERCSTLGASVRIEQENGAFVGIADRLDPDGALVVTTPDGERTVHVADVVHLRASGR